jgi:hypothetical protein
MSASALGSIVQHGVGVALAAANRLLVFGNPPACAVLLRQLRSTRGGADVLFLRAEENRPS